LYTGFRQSGLEKHGPARKPARLERLQVRSLGEDGAIRSNRGDIAVHPVREEAALAGPGSVVRVNDPQHL
jgi:hypothetical protein